MSTFFSPDGSLNIAIDASDLPETGDGNNSHSGALVRCKNMRTNENGKAITRDGSVKLNATALETAIWWIEEQGGSRFSFAGTKIYENESSIATGLTNAQWVAIKYNAFNDTTDNIFALNGTDRKRIESSTAHEWGIAAPTTAPTLSKGQAKGLTGKYNAKYTYLRKVGDVIVSESNPSPAADLHREANDESLGVSITASSDSQVTHVRLYRTLNGGVIYFIDQEIPAAGYTHGVSELFEDTDDYITGLAYKFTIEDATHGTENTYTWEEQPDIDIDDNSGYSSGNNWWNEDEGTLQEYQEIIAERKGLGGNVP